MVSYEIDERRLRILMADGSMCEFDGVPTQLFHGMPSGETSASYFIEKLRGRFAMRVIIRPPTEEERLASIPMSRLDQQTKVALENKANAIAAENTQTKRATLKAARKTINESPKP